MPSDKGVYLKFNFHMSYQKHSEDVKTNGFKQIQDFINKIFISTY